MHPRPAGTLLGIFGRHGSREYRFAGGGRNCASWSGSRFGGGRSRRGRARRRRFLSRWLSCAAGQTFLYEIAIFEVCGLVGGLLRIPFIRADLHFGLRHSRRGRERDGGRNRSGTESSKSRLHDDISLTETVSMEPIGGHLISRLHALRKSSAARLSRLIACIHILFLAVPRKKA